MNQKVLYLGMLGEFSRLPLVKLLAAGVNVCGVVVPGNKTASRPPISLLPLQKPVSNRSLPNPQRALTIVHLAWAQGIPVYELNQPGHPDTLAALAQLQPDVALVAGFSQILPSSLLALPRHGFFNLHPSQLPAYRGPDPIFWQLRDGINPVEVTLHVMTKGVDTGDVVGSTAVSLPDGISRHQIDSLCATAGADLMLATLEQLIRGKLSRQPQPPGGRYYSLPQPADFGLDLSWSAQRVFNFMRGTAEHGRPYPLQVAGQTIQLTEALAFEPDGALESTVMGNGREVLVQFAPGILGGNQAASTHSQIS